MKLNEIKIDAVKLEQGDWVGSIPEMGELRLKVRGLGNADYRRLMSRLTDALPRKHRAGGRVDPEKQDEIASACLLDTVLLDWEGLADEKDKPIPYDRTLARDLLSKPEFKRFRDAVVWAAQAVSEHDDETAEENAGN